MSKCVDVSLSTYDTASTTEDGKEYYYNLETKESQFELPQGALESAKAKAKRISDQVWPL